MHDTRVNCWEFMGCGREPGGPRAAELGACPASTDSTSEGINRGLRGGRFCWAVAGTLCSGDVEGIFARKLTTCLECPFYREVERQEGRDFVLLNEQALRSA